LTIQEIAAAHKMKLSAAKMRLYRALYRFKVKYEEKMGKN